MSPNPGGTRTAELSIVTAGDQAQVILRQSGELSDVLEVYIDGIISRDETTVTIQGSYLADTNLEITDVGFFIEIDGNFQKYNLGPQSSPFSTSVSLGAIEGGYAYYAYVEASTGGVVYGETKILNPASHLEIRELVEMLEEKPQITGTSGWYVIGKVVTNTTSGNFPNGFALVDEPVSGQALANSGIYVDLGSASSTYDNGQVLRVELEELEIKLVDGLPTVLATAEAISSSDEVISLTTPNMDTRQPVDYQGMYITIHDVQTVSESSVSLSDAAGVRMHTIGGKTIIIKTNPGASFYSQTVPTEQGSVSGVVMGIQDGEAVVMLTGYNDLNLTQERFKELSYDSFVLNGELIESIPSTATLSANYYDYTGVPTDMHGIAYELSITGEAAEGLYEVEHAGDISNSIGNGIWTIAINGTPVQAGPVSFTIGVYHYIATFDENDNPHYEKYYIDTFTVDATVLPASEVPWYSKISLTGTESTAPTDASPKVVEINGANQTVGFVWNNGAELERVGRTTDGKGISQHGMVLNYTRATSAMYATGWVDHLEKDEIFDIDYKVNPDAALQAILILGKEAAGTLNLATNIYGSSTAPKHWFFEYSTDGADWTGTQAFEVTSTSASSSTPMEFDVTVGSLNPGDKLYVRFRPLIGEDQEPIGSVLSYNGQFGLVEEIVLQ
ncbi:MAG: DUF5689 domain-containing protein [Rikenellaceae bacterium]|nr:DUF5689 domain-containing protein [Rikenellaceae bacterium]